MISTRIEMMIDIRSHNHRTKRKYNTTNQKQGTNTCKRLAIHVDVLYMYMYSDTTNNNYIALKVYLSATVNNYS